MLYIHLSSLECSKLKITNIKSNKLGYKQTSSLLLYTIALGVTLIKILRILSRMPWRRIFPNVSDGLPRNRCGFFLHSKSSISCEVTQNQNECRSTRETMTLWWSVFLPFIHPCITLLEHLVFINIVKCGRREWRFP